MTARTRICDDVRRRPCKVETLQKITRCGHVIEQTTTIDGEKISPASGFASWTWLAYSSVVILAWSKTQSGCEPHAFLLAACDRWYVLYARPSVCYRAAQRLYACTCSAYATLGDASFPIKKKAKHNCWVHYATAWKKWTDIQSDSRDPPGRTSNVYSLFSTTTLCSWFFDWQICSSVYSLIYK